MSIKDMFHGERVSEEELKKYSVDATLKCLEGLSTSIVVCTVFHEFKNEAEERQFLTKWAFLENEIKRLIKQI